MLLVRSSGPHSLHKSLITSAQGASNSDSLSTAIRRQLTVIRCRPLRPRRAAPRRIGPAE
ncbi:hypothetical protein MSG28_007372 [Choristoneura fumiferana]|uniref:Uncharacterized protein n=1 Tax=Choristoneura fumiferana TaxID=7141 RepID=A0ACC0JWP1_CHOFU|nr:hypothetical protein MSG28_007372 [Choristoneura fumiferana]